MLLIVHHIVRPAIRVVVSPHWHSAISSILLVVLLLLLLPVVILRLLLLLLLLLRVDKGWNCGRRRAVGLRLRLPCLLLLRLLLLLRMLLLRIVPTLNSLLLLLLLLLLRIVPTLNSLLLLLLQLLLLMLLLLLLLLVLLMLLLILLLLMLLQLLMLFPLSAPSLWQRLTLAIMPIVSDPCLSIPIVSSDSDPIGIVVGILPIVSSASSSSVNIVGGTSSSVIVIIMGIVCTASDASPAACSSGSGSGMPVAATIASWACRAVLSSVGLASGAVVLTPARAWVLLIHAAQVGAVEILVLRRERPNGAHEVLRDGPGRVAEVGVARLRLDCLNTIRGRGIRRLRTATRGCRCRRRVGQSIGHFRANNS